MNTPRGLFTLVAFMTFSFAMDKPLQAQDEAGHNDEMAVTGSMSSPHLHPHGESHAHMAIHMKWPPPRAQILADEQRAEEIAKTLRTFLEKYRDYRVAEQDGFKPFLPQLPQPMYHFTNYW